MYPTKIDTVNSTPDYLVGTEGGNYVLVPAGKAANGSPGAEVLNAAETTAVRSLVSEAWIASLVPTGYYGFALRASQPGFGSPVDQSGKLNDPTINTTLFPPARLNSTAYALNVYRSPAVLNGKLYKCTTAGTTAASEPAGLASAAIGATVTDGTAVWTVERGPWYTAASGFRHITSIASGLLPAGGAITCPAIAWNMAAGDSLIVRLRMAWNGAATDSRTALSENTIFGNRHASTSRNGFGIGGTGSTFGDLRFFISDGSNTFTSGHVASGFNRKPLDGNVRDTVFMVDGLLKRSYAWTDGVSYAQSEMFDAGNLTPHNADLAAVTGSTLNTNNIILGSSPGNAVTYDFGVMAADVIVLPGRALPTNLQAIADWYYSRGADALLPAELLL